MKAKKKTKGMSKKDMRELRDFVRVLADSGVSVRVTLEPKPRTLRVL